MSLGKDEGDLIYKEKWFEELGMFQSTDSNRGVPITGGTCQGESGGCTYIGE